MKSIFFLPLLLLLSLKSFSQNFVLAKSVGGLNLDHAESTVIDSHGNMLITGIFRDTVDFDPGVNVYKLSSKGANDIFILKLDSSGEFIWARNIGGANFDEVKSISTDKEGNCYITGIFETKSDFNPGIDTNYLVSNGSFDAFICKLDSNGNYKWAKNIGSIYGDEGRSLVTDSTGNIYVTGAFIGTVDFDPGLNAYNITSSSASLSQYDIFILKLDNDGNFLWALAFGNKDSDAGFSIGIDGLSNIYISGYFKGTVDFNPGANIFNLTSAIGGSTFILKLSNQGSFIWAKSISATMRVITVDKIGNSYITGVFSGIVDFNPGSGVFNINSSTTSMFLLRLNPKGNFEWAKKLEADVYSVTVDLYGNVYTTGGFGGKVDFDPGLDSTFLTSTATFDIFLLKMDSSSNFIWAVNTSGTKLGNGSGYSVVCDRLGNPYVVGDFADTVDFNPAKDVFKLVPKKRYDVFILKLLACSQAPINIEEIIGSMDVCEGTTSNYKIRPVKNSIGYTWDIPKDATLLTGQNSNSVFIKFGTLSGTISVKPYNSCGIAKSDSLKVIISLIPNIIKQPSDQKAILGSKAVFTLKTNNPNDQKQWQQNSGGIFTNLTNTGQFSGINTDTLSIMNTSIANNNSIYRCILTNASCYDTSVSVKLFVETSKIDNVSLKNYLKIYPNPMDDFIQLDVSKNFIGSAFCIKDALGRRMLDGFIDSEKKLVDIHSLSSGVYFIEIGDISKSTLKIIKN